MNKVVKSALIVSGVFWISDYVLHTIGVGESNFYFGSKLVNVLIFSFVFFLYFNYKDTWKRLAYSAVFGTWISLYYITAVYSTHFVQSLGVTARYTPPNFVIGSLSLSPLFWWPVHALLFFAGLYVADRWFGK